MTGSVKRCCAIRGVWRNSKKGKLDKPICSLARFSDNIVCASVENKKTEIF